MSGATELPGGCRGDPRGGEPAIDALCRDQYRGAAGGGIHKVREMLVKQHTMLINALRGLMAEFGIVVAKGPHHVRELVAILADPADQHIPTPLHEGLLAIVEALGGLERRIEIVEKQIVGWAVATAPAGT
jgi:transposase